ncbi:cation channel family protein (macronuclear) [Tetrahymena thermophila SB210]|uniref:Cation channel family protein n=1 Tax=Tetrahymena thermophila (strain SB210) TaxID=312017 RepID=I7M341_TETTS|nr:cation channel family protein [Tetrahymena thermophila SB210]EAS02102.2 cation channel family protein [Tetrahymena thermophila SB210]|eukprot:XP_001022347.2 cation channel family protein [Tetrahymena thermophila SB210]
MVEPEFYVKQQIIRIRATLIVIQLIITNFQFNLQLQNQLIIKLNKQQYLRKKQNKQIHKYYLIQQLGTFIFYKIILLTKRQELNTRNFGQILIMMSQEQIQKNMEKKNNDQSKFIQSITGLEESANCSREGVPFIKNFDEMPLQGVKKRRKLFSMDEDRFELEKRNLKQTEIDIQSDQQESKILKEGSKRSISNSQANLEMSQHIIKASLKNIQLQKIDDDALLKQEEKKNINHNKQKAQSEKQNYSSQYSRSELENSKNDDVSIEETHKRNSKSNSNVQDQEGDNETFEDSEEEEDEEDSYAAMSEDQQKQIQQIEKLLDLQSNIKKRGKKSKYALQNTSAMMTFNNEQQKKTETNTELKKASTLTTKEGANKQWKELLILSRVKKFVYKIKQYQMFSKFSNLNTTQLKCIGDQSYDTQQFLTKRKQSMILNTHQAKFLKFFVCFFQGLKVLNIFSSFSVITPNTNFALIWNIVLFFTITMQNICIPLRMSFGLDYMHEINFYILYLIPSIIMNLDLILNFFTAFYDQGVLVTNKKKIMKNYFQMQFWIDFVTNFSFVLIVTNQSFFLVDWIFMIKILQIPDYLNKIDEHFQLEQRFNTIFQLAKLFILNFFMAHYICCGFHYVAVQEIKSGQSGTWIDSLQLSNPNDYYTRYINSIYFSFITMITVGYGDITPKTNYEKIYVTVVISLSCGLFGYSINTIGSIFQEKSRREQNFRSIKFSITNYMRKRNISRNLQHLVLKNLEYKNQIETCGDLNGEQILNTLNEQLKNDVKEEYFFKILNEAKLFRLNFSRDCLKKLALKMREQLISPGEIIYKENTFNGNIYFLINGQIEFYFENKNSKKSHILSSIKHYQNGSIFNQMGFFCNFTTSSNARAAKTATSLCYVSYEDFKQVLQEYPLDYEALCKIKDNLSIYSRMNDILCFSCNNYGHFSNECPKYFPINFQQSKILYIYDQTEANQRKLQVRLRNFKCNSVQLIQPFRSRLVKYRMDVMQLLTQQVNQSNFETQGSRQSVSDKRFTKQMVKFKYDNSCDQYVEMPSSDEDYYQCEDEDDDEDEDDEDYELELEEYQKSQISKMSEAVKDTENNDYEIKSSFRRIAADEDSRLQAEYHKDIYSKNDRNQMDAKSDFQTQTQTEKLGSYQDSFQEKKISTNNAFTNESDMDPKSHVTNTPTLHKRELDSRKNSNYTSISKNTKYRESREGDDSYLKRRHSNLIYEEKSKVSEEDYDQDEDEDEDDERYDSYQDNEKDQKSEYILTLLQQNQVQRSNSASSSKKNIQTSSNKQALKNGSRSEMNSLYQDKQESLYNNNNTRSIVSITKQASNISQGGGRNSALGMKKKMTQQISSSIRNSSKQLSINMKQGTLDYLNSVHFSINNQSEYEKTFKSQSSMDPVQYKASQQNFSSTACIRAKSHTGGALVNSMQEVQKSKSNKNLNNAANENTKPSMKRMQTVSERHSKLMKDPLSSRIPLYDEGFSAIKEFEVYFPINNLKSVMKKLKLYQLKTIIQLKKEQPKKKKAKAKRKIKNSESKKRSTSKNSKIPACTNVYQPANNLEHKLSINAPLIKNELQNLVQ